MTNRNATLFLAILTLTILALTGCKAGTNAPTAIVQEQETYYIEITDHSAFNAEAPLTERLDKELSDDNLINGTDLQNADWPMRLLLTNSPVQQMAHSDLGGPPLATSSSPISALINLGYLIGWSAKEAGKQAVNAGTPNYIVRMRLHIVDPEGTVWRIDDEIALYTLNKEKSQEKIAREASGKIEEYLAASRAGEKIDNAVEETNSYELKRMRGDIK